MFFKYVKKGDRIEVPTAEFYNAIVSVLNKESFYRRGTNDRQDNLEGRFKSPRKHIYIRANADIVEYSIFTITKSDTIGTGSGEEIETGTGTFPDDDDMGFDPRYPKVYSKQVDSTTNDVLICNGQQGLGADGNYILDILAEDTPFIVNLDTSNGVPEVGEQCGPKPGTYKVAKGYTGCTTVSGISRDGNNRIWVVRTITVGLVELCAQETATRGVPYTALLGTWDSSLNSWCYEGASVVYAIDHRYGMPHAEEGWKGLYQSMPSATYGIIYDCVSLDCELPPEGCACSGTGG